MPEEIITRDTLVRQQLIIAGFTKSGDQDNIIAAIDAADLAMIEYGIHPIQSIESKIKEVQYIPMSDLMKKQVVMSKILEVKPKSLEGDKG